MLIGSHLDSQPTGGRFDGALGTFAAFEVLEALEDAGHETASAIEVVAWTNEEGSRFAPGVMGSMAFVGVAHPDDFRSVVSGDGESFSQELAATLVALPEATMRPLGTPISAYLELHIEQGPSLEREGLAAGVITAVHGTRWLAVTFSGRAGHAGTTSLCLPPRSDGSGNLGAEPATNVDHAAGRRRKADCWAVFDPSGFDQCHTGSCDFYRRYQASGCR